MSAKILLLNGPNLNLLGNREPEVYGTTTLAELEHQFVAAAREMGYDAEVFQSNHEGELIDRVHAARTDCAGIVINPGGLTHTSVSLRDALTGVGLPFAEVHLSDIHAREEFRRHSFLSDVAAVRVIGEGASGYQRALRELLALIA